MALSSIIGRNIQSLFPVCNQKGMQNLFSGIVHPRSPQMNDTQPVIIFWYDTSLHGKRPLYKANHCVPLFAMETSRAFPSINVVNQSSVKTSEKRKLPPNNEGPVRKQVKIEHCFTREKSSQATILTQEQSLPETKVEASEDASDAAKEAKANPSLEMNKRDIGIYSQVQSLSDNEKYELISDTWRPDQTYVFPVTTEGGRPKRFQYKWLTRFTWLAYSKHLNGTFCVPCVLFGRQCGHNSSKLVKLFKSPLTYWTSALTKLKDHLEKSQLHHAAMLQMDQFKTTVQSKEKQVDVMMDTVRKTRINNNREKMKSIFKTVIFCGKQNIAFRGHRDDASARKSKEIYNTGNFQQLLDFRVESGDRILAEHFKTAPKNATYRSKTIQNEMIDCCSKLISNSLVAEIKKAKVFSVLPDEAKDVSNHEQMVLVVRFVDEEHRIREEFLKFIHCDAGTSGEALANEILSHVRDLGLDMDNCRGQGYDGSGNIAGKNKGTARRIRNVYPKAVYVHCASHRLNLAVAGACDLQIVRNMMSSVRVVSDFFNNSPKRQSLLEKRIVETMPEQKQNTLIDVCRTRWILRIDGLIRFEELFESIMDSLEIIKDNVDRSWNQESCKDASTLFAACSSFQFILALVVVRNCLAYIRGATMKLQRESMDMIKAYDEIDDIKDELRSVRRNLDIKFEQWFSEARSLSSYVGSDVQMPRTCARQINRENYPGQSSEEYYRRSIATPFLDHLLSELDSRFNPESKILASGFNIVPKVMRKQENIWREEFLKFTDEYKDDLPLLKSMNAEIDRWSTRWSRVSEKDLPDRLSDTLQMTDELSYPNIYASLKIMATVPITTCTCERSISVLRRLKTYLRSTMKQERMNGLALLHIHREMNLNIEKLINMFASQYPRRMEMRDILNSD
eukprot:Seg2834.3 transcript_id=Seg2834.3/GoldUCD/mRNA.D3Y31 product="52 kDa repressor of the inhibitor of the protein kinase" protein_id=Seg2834.3/GoldUCD/D3Y31